MKRTPILILALCGVTASGVFAQPTRNLILGNLDVIEQPESHRVEVTFANPVRYLRHAPRNRGRVVEVQIQLLALAPEDLAASRLRESLRPPVGDPSPLEEVVYDGDPRSGPTLEFRLRREARFEVRQGSDLRSLVMVILKEKHTRSSAPATPPQIPPMPAPPDLDSIPIHIEHRFAVEIEAIPYGIDPLAPPDHPLFERYRLYRVEFRDGDQLTYHYRLGFLPSRKAADQARDALRAWYPDAQVVPTSRGERAASAQQAVSARTLRNLAAQPIPEPRAPEAVPATSEPVFAVELESVAEGSGPRPPPDHPLFERHRLYRVRFQSGDDRYYRYRLGFLSREQAERALVALRAWYPDAGIVQTSEGERAASERTALSADALRIAGDAGTTGSRQPAEPMPTTDDGSLLTRARAAMTGGELDLAIRLLTAILTDPASPEAAEAQELLGLARERRGQLAHAKAEYETYLARHPNGSGADRVRQRLDALLTRSAPSRPALRPSRTEGPEWDVTTFGSLYASYYRGDLWGGVQGGPISDSVAFTDLDLSMRARKGDLDVRARGAGSYRYDIPLDSSIDEFRLNSLFIEASDRGRDLEGSLGRQSANSAGVLGRFDGLRLGVGVLDGWKLGGVAGLPVGFSRALELDTDRVFAGLSLDTPRFLESIEGQVWALGQQALGMTDRAAVGGEIRYFAPWRFVAGFVDYDVYFGQLNTALLIANWNTSKDTSFNLTLDHRLTPTLTLQNALIGQTVRSLGALRDGFSSAEIEELAADRTARSSLGMLGVTHHLTERVQINGDASVTRLSGTPASGGVAETEGTDLEYALGVQLLASDTWIRGDVTTFGLRGFAGDFTDSYSVDLGSRLPLTEQLRVNPRVLVRYDDRTQGSDAIVVAPGLRTNWQVWKIDLDADLVFEWTQRSGGLDAGDEYGYRLQLGLRYDFR